MTDSRRIGLIFVMLAAVGYSFLPIFTRSIYSMSDLVPTDIAIWRFVFATPVIWLLLVVRQRVRTTPKAKVDEQLPRIRLLLMGIVYTGAALAAFYGLQYVEAGIFGVLFHTYPAMVAILALFLGQRLSNVGWVALGLTLVGVVMTVPDLSISGENTTLGLSIALLNAFIVAVYFLLVGRLLRGVSSPARGSAYIITGTLITLSLFIPFFGLNPAPNLIVWLNLAGMALISTALPILFINIGIQQIGPTQTAILTAFEPVGTLILAGPILGEFMLPIQWLGAALIVAAVILLAVGDNRKGVPAQA